MLQAFPSSPLGNNRMRDIFVPGVGMTCFGVHAEKTSGDLARQPAHLAKQDAAGDPDTVNAVFYANTAQGAREGQHALCGQHALLPIGMESAPTFNIGDAWARSAAPLHLAFVQVAGGPADVALAVGAEKLHTDDRAKRLAIFAQPPDMAGVTDFVRGRGVARGPGANRPLFPLLPSANP